MPVPEISRSLSKRHQRERNVRVPQWAHTLTERSKTGTMHHEVFWPSDIVERVDGWRPKAADERTHRHGTQVFCGIWRDDRHGKPMGTMSVDVDSTKLIKTSEVGNSNSSLWKKGAHEETHVQLARVKFEMQFKDHEL